MKILLFILINLSMMANAIGTRGGGDLCENRIQTISADFLKWIDKNGFHGLTLPPGITAGDYSTKMTTAITQTKIKCVGPTDSPYPIQIDGTPKVCIFENFGPKSNIICDSTKFQNISESDQYVLVHHEFAGIAGIENPNGDISTYTLSNQISGFLENTIVKKLTIRSHAPLLQDASLFFQLKGKYIDDPSIQYLFEGLQLIKHERSGKEFANTYSDGQNQITINYLAETDEFDSIVISPDYPGKLPFDLRFGQSRGSVTRALPVSAEAYLKNDPKVSFEIYEITGVEFMPFYDSNFSLINLELDYRQQWLAIIQANPSYYRQFKP